MIGMAYHFGLHPWDIGRLTIGYFEMYAGALDQMAQTSEERAKQEGRPSRKR